MDYKLYKKSRDLSWKIILQEGIKGLPVNVSALCRNMGITVRLYEPTDQNSGYSTLVPEGAIIYISKSEPVRRQRFTAAHELGHILNGDLGKYKLVNRGEPSPDDNPIEQAANVFASRLLAPACVLWGIGVQSAKEISELCDISMPAAEFRWERMKELYKRDKFLTSPLEREVFERFKGFIEKNRLNQG